MEANRKKKITILSPAYNEQEALPFFYKAVSELASGLGDKYNWEFLFVNDGSSDGTLQILQDLVKKDRRVRYVDLSRNFGKEVAMLAGFDNASGDCVVIIDADLQEPVSAIPAMIEKWEEGYCDVYGLRKTRKEKYLKKLTSKIYQRLLSGMSQGPKPLQNCGDFRLLDRKCIEALRSMRESQRYTKGMYSLIGFSKTPVEIDLQPRVAGTTKWSFKQLMHLAVDGIMSHSVTPLRLTSYMGMIVSLIAFIYIIFVITKALIWGDPVDGYPSLMSVTLFLGGFILLALGIIGEYLGRIFLETKRRPPYFTNTVTPVNDESEENN